MTSVEKSNKFEEENLLESFQHRYTAGEHSVGEEECVEEVNGEEPKVCQPQQKSLWSGVSNLRHFAIVQTS